MPKVESSIVLEAYFEEGDPRFLAEVLRSTSGRLLGAFAQRWLADPRPELRRMLLEYIDDGLERPHHQPLSKRLFKLAESKKDHEAMAHFLVACDRLIRRRIVKRYKWDPQTRTSGEEEVLEMAPSVPMGAAPTRGMSAEQIAAKKRIIYPATYTYATRRYMQRRAWRYFRELGQKSPEIYREAIVLALQLYRDDQLREPIQLLDAWGLVHTLYHFSPALVQERPGWSVKPGASLADVRTAPIFLDAWKSSPQASFDLLVRANARTVRLFAVDILRTHHRAALEKIGFDDVRRILASPDEDVQLFAAELLRHARGIELLVIDDWLRLLKVGNAMAIPVLAELFEKHVSPDRVSNTQAVELARSNAAPVAALGLKWLRARPIRSFDDITLLLRLADAPSDTVRGEAIDWLIASLKDSSLTSPLHVRELIDAPFSDVRQKAIVWMLNDRRFKNELTLWAAMTETPYDDVRATLVRHLEEAKSSIDRTKLEHVWATVLLAVHRGSRAKAVATRQIAERIIARPEDADGLLPLLGVALRSLRVPERRNAIAAIGRAAFFASGLREKISRHLPGLVVRNEG